jgi:hypothetical protein
MTLLGIVCLKLKSGESSGELAPGFQRVLFLRRIRSYQERVSVIISLEHFALKLRFEVRFFFCSINCKLWISTFEGTVRSALSNEIIGASFFGP